MELLGKSSVIASRPSALLIAAIAAGAVLLPSRAQAQWWSRAPADFEECADAAEKAATKEAKASALTECNAKFAGRRKPGGGYTYYDFMQNRSFDIAGPNPTPEEQKHIDEQYTAFLDRERRNSIAAALAAKQQQHCCSRPRCRTKRRGEKGAAAGGGAQQATGRRERLQAALQGCDLRAAYILLRLAAAFRKPQGSEEGAVRRVVGQGEAELDRRPA